LLRRQRPTWCKRSINATITITIDIIPGKCASCAPSSNAALTAAASSLACVFVGKYRLDGLLQAAAHLAAALSRGRIVRRPVPVGLKVNYRQEKPDGAQTTWIGRS
jgi:hypothetical protein